MVAIRQSEMICFHAHGDTIVDALRELADGLDAPDYRKLVLMDVFTSEATAECGAGVGRMCMTALMAVPGTGKMIRWE